MMETIVEKLRKIEALASRGVAGERESARRMLEKLCRKHGVTLEQISTAETRNAKFTLKNKLERDLLIQIVGYICQVNKVSYAKGSSGRTIWIQLTAAQEVDVRECFTYYRRQWEKQLPDWMSAFVHKHNLFPPSEGSEREDLSAEAIERARRLLAMMRGIDGESWSKRLKLEGCAQ